MKKLFYLLLLCLTVSVVAPSCRGEKEEESEASTINLDSINNELRDSLALAQADLDTLMSLMNDVSDGLSEIKDLEKIITTTDFSTESSDRKSQLRGDVAAIRQSVQARIKKLDELEGNLKKSNALNGRLQETITTLRRQLEDQQAMITDLTRQLDAANAKIETLNTRVDSLKVENTTVTREREEARQDNVKLTNEMNECYYIIGTKKELKQHKIVEGGFLRKTKIMEGDFQRTVFTKADKRTLNQIALHSKKAKVLSKHPSDSYQIVDNNGQKVLHITNSNKFWELSNYLVIQVD